MNWCSYDMIYKVNTQRHFDVVSQCPSQQNQQGHVYWHHRDNKKRSSCANQRKTNDLRKISMLSTICMKADRSDQVILLLPNITENLFLHFIFINVFFFLKEAHHVLQQVQMHYTLLQKYRQKLQINISKITIFKIHAVL